MAELDGKTALVTGGTSGIGLASARRHAQEGAHVFLTGRRQHAIDQAVAQLHAVRAASATGVRADVSDQDDLIKLFSTIRGRGDGLEPAAAQNLGTEMFHRGLNRPCSRAWRFKETHCSNHRWARNRGSNQLVGHVAIRSVNQ